MAHPEGEFLQLGILVVVPPAVRRALHVAGRAVVGSDTAILLHGRKDRSDLWSGGCGRAGQYGDVHCLVQYPARSHGRLCWRVIRAADQAGRAGMAGRSDPAFGAGPDGETKGVIDNPAVRLVVA